MIDKVFAQSTSVSINGKPQEITVFEGIVLVLEQKVGEGRRQALTIKRKYEDYAKAHPKTIVQPDLDPTQAAKIYEEYLRTGVYPGHKPRKPSKAEIELVTEMANLTREEMQALYEATLKSED